MQKLFKMAVFFMFTIISGLSLAQEEDITIVIENDNKVYPMSVRYFIDDELFPEMVHIPKGSHQLTNLSSVKSLKIDKVDDDKLGDVNVDIACLNDIDLTRAKKVVIKICAHSDRDEVYPEQCKSFKVRDNRIHCKIELE
jgi:hypothetical protein